MGENRISDKKVINSFCDVLPYLKDMFEEDVSFAMTDTEKYLLSVNGRELVFKIREGDPIPEGGAVKEALKTGNSVIKNVSGEVYGIPFRSYAIPLKHDCRIVGVFVLGKSFARKEQILTIAQKVASAIHETSDAMGDLVQGIKSIEQKNLLLLDHMKQASKKTDETNKIVNFIQNISTQTYLLGVNASIDAARAGIYGKGFEVVAQEIGSLSQTIKESIAQIDDILDYLTKSITIVTGGLDESMGIFMDQSKDLDKIAGAIAELKDTSSKLERLSESF